MKTLFKRTVPLTLIFWVFAVFILGSAAPLPTPSVNPMNSPTPVPSGAFPKNYPSQSPSSSPSSVAVDSNTLLIEFQRAQKTELKALEHRFKFELKELKASQAAMIREWDKKEQEARHKFFEDHPKGPDRRTYVQDFIQRREALMKAQTDERNQMIHDQDVRNAVVKQDQMNKFKDFKKVLDAGGEPSSELWPRPGI